MGKQTAIALTGKDEQAFLDFLRESADIQIFVSFAPTIQELRVDDFVPDEWQFLIWNKRFSWTPEYGQVTGDKSGRRQGWHYIRHKSAAPAIEYSRHNFTGEHGQNGRIYWGKGFSAPEGLSYDVEEFNKWYSQVVRWLRKHGKRKSQEAYTTYYLPDAWSKYGDAG